MSNVVQLEQYRNFKNLLATDEEFRSWVKSFINEVENPSPVLDFSKIKAPQNYTIRSVTINGVDVTPG